MQSRDSLAIALSGAAREFMESDSSRSPLATAVRAVILAAVGSYFCQPIFDSAIWGAMARGEWISLHHAVPAQDYWTLAGQGWGWSCDSWLFDLLCAEMFRVLGFHGLILVELLSVLLFVGIAAWSFSARAANAFLGTGLALLAALGIFSSHTFGAEFFALSFFLLLLELTLRFAVRPQFSTWLPLAAAAVLYANMHSSFLPAVMVGYIILQGHSTLPPAARRRCGLLYAMVFLALLGTPYFGTQLGSWMRGYAQAFAGRMSGGEEAATIYHYDFGAVFLLLFLYAAVMVKDNRAMPRSSGVLILFAAVGALSFRPLMPFALVLMPFLLAGVWPRFSREASSDGATALAQLEAKLAQVSPIGVLWLALCLFIVNVYKLWEQPVMPVLLPEKAVEAYLAAGAPMPILHDPSIGGYLEFRFLHDPRGQGAKPAWDERVSLFDPRLAFLARHFTKLGLGWEQVFLLGRPAAVLCREIDPLAAVLLRDSQWKVAYRTEVQVPKDDPDSARRAALQQKLLGWVLFVKSE